MAGRHRARFSGRGGRAERRSHVEQGAEAYWVRTRTGHTSNELLRYRETARSLEELELGDVAALVDAIPELDALHRALSVAPANDVTVLENDPGTPEGGPGLARTIAAPSEVVDLTCGAEGDRTRGSLRE